MTPRFLQIHQLVGFGASLLNRDDLGMAKRLPFGGATRTRVSSQCLKRHWRRAESEWSFAQLGTGPSVRSRETFYWHVVRPLVAEGRDRETVIRTVQALQAELLGESDKAKATKAKDADKEAQKDPAERVATNQVIVLGKPEIDHIRTVVAEIASGLDKPEGAAEAVKERFKNRQFRDNLRGLVAGGGIDAALFGRMTTSDILARLDAAVHVAHAFTVHAQSAETDYFSAVDDLVQEHGETGSGHIGEAELTSGLFYLYVVVDLPQLVSNLTGRAATEWRDGDTAVARDVARRLIPLIATTSPGAKLGATAPYAHAEFVLGELGERQPRSLANAFFEPLPLTAPAGEDGSPLARAVDRLAGHLAALDRMYGEAHREDRRHATVLNAPPEAAEAAAALGGRASVPEIGDWAAGALAAEPAVA
ncbi:MAG: type I-E CRISPR-associated protein Cas7/Cse4/CasC [Azospirillaceae bacterium]